MRYVQCVNFYVSYSAEKNAYTMTSITKAFWEDSDLFEFSSIRDIFQSTLMTRLLKNIDPKIKNEIINENYPEAHFDCATPYVKVLHSFHSFIYYSIAY